VRGYLLLTHDEPAANRLMRHEQTGQLAMALDRLSFSHRQSIVLRHLEGLSFAEIAARMGRSVGAVRKLSARGLSVLRRELADEE
jgi:RNA polymerase sigma-70 factor (ECF subfamily)